MSAQSSELHLLEGLGINSEQARIYSAARELEDIYDVEVFSHPSKYRGTNIPFFDSGKNQPLRSQLGIKSKIDKEKFGNSGQLGDFLRGNRELTGNLSEAGYDPGLGAWCIYIRAGTSQVEVEGTPQTIEHFVCLNIFPV